MAVYSTKLAGTMIVRCMAVVYSETEFDDFIEWLQRERIEPGELEEDDYESDCFVELFDDWRNSDDYQHKQVD